MESVLISMTLYPLLVGFTPLSPKQCILKHRSATLNNTAWLQIMKKVIDALHHVHGLGIIHRDLKTDNVVFYCSDSLQPVIIDFGKSVYACSAKKFVLSEAKKVEYRQNHKHIAPDLIDGLVKPSPASDVYSFGRLFKNVICYFPLNVSELPSSVKHIVKLCLRYDHAERPTCESITKILIW